MQVPPARSRCGSLTADYQDLDLHDACLPIEATTVPRTISKFTLPSDDSGEAVPLRPEIIVGLVAQMRELDRP